MDRARNAGPYLISTNGIGAIISAKKPSKVLAHRGFKVSYTANENWVSEMGIFQKHARTCSVLRRVGTQHRI